MKIAFVAPFFGTEAAGGAEAECRKTALHLARAGLTVDVLTTCARDLHHDWHARFHEPGAHREHGITVHRFPVHEIDLTLFGHLNEALLAGRTLTPEQERHFIARFVNSFDLLRHLAAHVEEYDFVCFIPYLFGTTYYGTRLCPEKAVLIPCLHDEPYARLGICRELFQRVHKIVFHARAEEALAEQLYGFDPARSVLLGEGIDTDFESKPDRFRRRHGIRDPFLLYAGRKDETKNVPALIRWFAAYKARKGGNLRCVLIGPESVPTPPECRADILDLGFVSEQDKKDAYSAAAIFCQPSLNESFSIVMMEAWLCNTPCLVHGDCPVTREHIVRSGGGLYFTSYPEFEGCLDYLLREAQTAHRMGRCGAQYVRDNFAWPTIVRRYREHVFRT